MIQLINEAIAKTRALLDALAQALRENKKLNVLKLALQDWIDADIAAHNCVKKYRAILNAMEALK